MPGHRPIPHARMELLKLAEICSQVVENPARTLDEAVNATWITWVALHQESTNAGLSLGRLDQWFQPYFAADMARLTTDAERDEYIRHAIELIGCFYMRCTDHLPLTPDLANFYFGGSSSDQAITLGGVTPDGEDAVCDMTYIFLKVTEMLVHPRPQCECTLPPRHQQRHLSEAAVRGEPHHRGHPVHAQRRGGHGLFEEIQL